MKAKGIICLNLSIFSKPMDPTTHRLTYSGIFILKLVFALLICLIPQKTFSQSTYYSFSTEGLFKIEVDDGACSCSVSYVSDIAPYLFPNGLTFTPDTILVSQSGNGTLYELDTLTGDESIIFDSGSSAQIIYGIVSIGNGIFYGMGASGIVFRININEGTITELGATGFGMAAGITLFNGNIYFSGFNGSGLNGIVLLDTNDVTNSQMVVTFPPGYGTGGLTASHICNNFLAVGGTGQSDASLILVNIIDGTITPICPIPPEAMLFFEITSMLEFADLSDCDITLDLDCNNSSGATESDYNSPEYNCFSLGVGIADEDTRMTFDAYITTMEIHLTGNVPDTPNEVLVSAGGPANIDVSGSGTDMITLSNSGGAKSKDFKSALRSILYKNNATPLTPGPRTVEVQFTTETGAMSNIATAFIDVLELPILDLDLGPDQQWCEGENTILDAGNPGATYTWSTGSPNQTITVDESGEYSVTVSDGVHCPNADTLEIELLPVIDVALIGDTQTCDNESANLSIQTNTPFSLVVDVSSDPGSPFHFTNVTGDVDFTDLITQSTTYTITNVTSSQDACINITDPVQVIEVYPTYELSVDVSLCNGDSIWLGYNWESEAGVYDNLLTTSDGCDSSVTTTITILPAITISKQNTTCDSASAGVFISYLNNANGCDTVVTTTVNLLPSDTTKINLLSCNQAEVGITTQTLFNQNGCDSLVITTTGYIPPTDTTAIFQTTCDSASLGVIYDTLTRVDGCDSLIITTISIAASDTTFLNGISCDPSSIGVSQTVYNNAMGCDSLVITTIVAGLPDTTYLFSTSCDSSSLGVVYNASTGSDGCDSLVISTVTYSAQDSTFITSTSCDPSEVGVFIQTLINSFGCDSIVTETITLLPSDATAINSTTCDPADAGVFISTLTNQYGCDSTVTETITLQPSDATFLSGTTCKSSEAGMFITTHLNQYGCDSIVTLTVSLIPSDTTILSFNTCDPSEVGNVENLLIGQDGCDSLVIETISLFPLPQLNLVITSDFNGYGISCFGEHDGSIEAATTGEDPFQYSWSTGDTTQSITGLGAGDFDVLITDANGCMASRSISLNQPEVFSIGFEVSQPDCFTNEAGTITVLQSGGVLPVRYSKDGINYQSSPIFSNLTAGSYTITALDANDCEAKEIIMINVSIDINVDLGDDQIIMPGDTSTIEALVNVPFDSLASITWTGLMNPDCPTCLTQFVVPIITTAYTVSVSNAQGCTDLDSMIVFVQRNIDIYVPNVFSPNSDGINDRLLISAGADVEEIESFTIFDRWGNMIYLNEHFLPNDPGEAWDGKRKGVTVNPGVYAYKMLAKFADGRTEIRYGDVTLFK